MSTRAFSEAVDKAIKRKEGLLFMSWKNIIQNPPGEYRPIPFLALNDDLCAQELRCQIREMAKAGLGGYFLHARSGLKTAYMSAEWMRLIWECLDEAKKVGLDTWLYDEDGYPSGFANGAIPALGIAYHKKWILEEEVTEAVERDHTIAFYVIEKDFSAFHRVLSSADTKTLPPHQKLIHFFWDHDPYYVDVLDKKVIRAFIEAVHEVYRHEFSEEFGKGMKGIFTDEPQYSGPSIPWSFVLAQEFQQEHQYDLLDFLPCLRYELPGCEKIRYDYWQSVNRLFTTAYSEQIGQWCAQNDMLHTGHINCEEELSERMRNDAGAMSFYRYMDMPGVDWLARHIGTPVTVKQVSSIAHQFHKERVICETYGGCGWNVSFEELKWISEWLYVLGVNTTCQHLQLYSLRGQRKNDYPPSLYFQQPWWNEYKALNDHLARLSVLLTQGRHLCDILLLHPLRSAWISYRHDEENQGLGTMDQDFEAISRWLLEEHLDFDYGDEGSMQEIAAVDGSAKICMGQACYSLVILPNCVTLEKATEKLLLEFLKVGGTVISAGRFPTRLSGEEASERLRALRSQTIETSFSREALVPMVHDHLKKGLSIVHPDGTQAAFVYAQQRRLEDESDLLFTLNTAQQDLPESTFSLPGNWSVAECDLESAEVVQLPFKLSENTTVWTAHFCAMQSHLFVLSKKETEKRIPASQKSLAKEQAVSDQWSMRLDDLNSLVLDYAQVAINHGAWSERLPIFRIFENLMKLQKPAHASLRFCFEMKIDPSDLSEVFLALETPEQYQLQVNGKVVEQLLEGWWRDKSIQKIPVGAYLLKGSNQIQLEVDFACSAQAYHLANLSEIHSTLFNKMTIDMELCNLILLGEFGVYSENSYTHGETGALFTQGPFYIDALPSHVKTGDLVQQGLCFYSGNVFLTQDLPCRQDPLHAILQLSHRPEAVLYKIFLNGVLCDTRLWAPYQSPLKLNAGQNTLCLQLFNSCRNLFGPHHHILGEPQEVGPSSFTDKKGWVERKLTADTIWTDRYCFVAYGLPSAPMLMEIEEGGGEDR